MSLKSFALGIVDGLVETFEAVVDIAKNPKETFEAVKDAVTNPVETTKAIIESAKNTYTKFKNADADEKHYMLGKGVVNLIGGGAGVKATKTVKNTLDITTRTKLSNRQKNKFLKEGAKLDRNRLTKAGRALQKHGDREGSSFPKATGNFADKNKQGQKILKKILDSDNLSISKNKKGGVEIRDKNQAGIGAAFNKDGSFKGFREKKNK